jgi:hypothetical protein
MKTALALLTGVPVLPLSTSTASSGNPPRLPSAIRAQSAKSSRRPGGDVCPGNRDASTGVLCQLYAGNGCTTTRRRTVRYAFAIVRFEHRYVQCANPILSVDHERSLRLLVRSRTLHYLSCTLRFVTLTKRNFQFSFNSVS